MVSNQREVIVLQIISKFNIYTTHSKSKNHLAMFALVLLNSNFEELAQTCKKSHKSGINYFYEFARLEIVGLSKNKIEATVRGTIILIMPDIDIIYRGKFISSCCSDMLSKGWKLNEIEIEWE